MSGIADLIERLEKLEGPDREVDDLLGALAYGTDPIGIFMPGSRADKALPHYTASLDAAVALIERVLPGWGWDVASNTEHIKACLNPEFGTPVGRHPHWAAVANTSSKLFHDGATPALALCLALLRALAEQEGRDDE